jgi:hypothetical protein
VTRLEIEKRRFAIFKRIKKTGRINSDDAEYITRHPEHFEILMFVRKKR